MGRGNGEQAQQVTATHKAAAWIEAAGRKQENLKSCLICKRLGEEGDTSFPSVCQVDDGSLAGTEPKSLRTVWVLATSSKV